MCVCLYGEREGKWMDRSMYIYIYTHPQTHTDVYIHTHRDTYVEIDDTEINDKYPYIRTYRKI